MREKTNYMEGRQWVLGDGARIQSACKWGPKTGIAIQIKPQYIICVQMPKYTLYVYFWCIRRLNAHRLYTRKSKEKGNDIDNYICTSFKHNLMYLLLFQTSEFFSIIKSKYFNTFLASNVHVLHYDRKVSPIEIRKW